MAPGDKAATPPRSLERRAASPASGRGGQGAQEPSSQLVPSLAASWEVLPIWSGRSQGVGGAHPSSKAQNGTNLVTREAALLSLPDSALPHFAPCPGDNPTGPEKRGVKEGTGVALGVCRGLSVSPAEQGCARWPDLDMGRWQTPAIRGGHAGGGKAEASVTGVPLGTETEPSLGLHGHPTFPRCASLLFAQGHQVPQGHGPASPAGPPLNCAHLQRHWSTSGHRPWHRGVGPQRVFLDPSHPPASWVIPTQGSRCLPSWAKPPPTTKS